jgi:hypothetical protein
MEKNHAIIITQNANGFTVTPTCDLNGGYMISEVHVFNSMADLITWIAQHFSHRSPMLNSDSIQLTSAQQPGVIDLKWNLPGKLSYS